MQPFPAADGVSPPITQALPTMGLQEYQPGVDQFTTEVPAFPQMDQSTFPQMDPMQGGGFQQPQQQFQAPTQQQNFPQQGAMGQNFQAQPPQPQNQMPPPSQPPQPAASGQVAAQSKPTGDGKTSHVNVVLQKQPGDNSWGFTPFKWSLSEARDSNSVKGFDMQDLLKKCDFAGQAGGLPLQAVTPGTPAARAGLQPWDVVVAVNQMDVRTDTGASAIQKFKQFANDAQVTIMVLRSNTPPAPPEITAIPTGGLCGCCGGATDNEPPAQNTNAI